MSDLVTAKEAIRELHAHYTDAVWRKDYASFGDCFAEDAEWRIGGLVLQGRAQITETIERILGNFKRVLITFQTPLLEVEGRTAFGRTYITEQVARVNGQSNVSIGRYYERFVYHGDRWRFAWRLFQLHYSGPPDLSGTFFDNPDYGPPPGMPELDANSGDFASSKWGISPAG